MDIFKPKMTLSKMSLAVIALSSTLLCFPLNAETPDSIQTKLAQSLDRKLQVADIAVSSSDSGTPFTFSIPQKSEMSGIKCQLLPDFSQNEGIDDLIRLETLKALRSVTVLSDLLSDDVIQTLKRVQLRSLQAFSQRSDLDQKTKATLAVLLKTENMNRYVFQFRKVRDIVWMALSPDLRLAIVNEMKAQTGFAADTTINLLSVDKESQQAKIDATFMASFKKTTICFADFVTQDDKKITALIPLSKTNTLSSRSLVDAGFSMKKLESSLVSEAGK